MEDSLEIVYGPAPDDMESLTVSEEDMSFEEQEV